MPAQNLFQSYLQPVKSVAEYTADYDAQDLRRAQMENAQRQNALAALQFGAQQDEIAQKRKMQNALQAVYADPANSTPQALESALIRNPLTADRGWAMQKERLGNAKLEADTGKTKAETGKTQGETMDATLKRYRSGLDFVDTPQSAARWLKAQYDDPTLSQHMQSFGTLEQAIAQIPTDAAGFQRWRQQNALGMDAFTKMQQEDKKIVETERNNRAQVAKDIENNIRTNQTSRANNAETTKLGYARLNSENERAREKNAIDRSAAETQIINDPNQGVLLVNKKTGVTSRAADTAGAPIPSEAEGKRTANAKNALALIDEADKLIDTSTGSYLGTGADMAAQAFGATTEGAKASAKLKVLQASLMMNQPRMEGPQSDKDVQLYREAAGQIGDPTVPRDIKKAALSTIRQINERYAGLQPGANRADALQGVTAKPSGAKKPSVSNW